MFVTTYNVNERIFTGICKKFSTVTEANCSYRPPEKKGTLVHISKIHKSFTNFNLNNGYGQLRVIQTKATEVISTKAAYRSYMVEKNLLQFCEGFNA
jgi:hypothetical protein